MPTASVTQTPATPDPVPSLKGDNKNAWAFAPLNRPSEVTVEGHVRQQRAWSTSKVLVAAAYIDKVAGGDPKRLTSAQTSLIEAALTRSDMDAAVALGEGIPGGKAGAMTSVLRSIGDNTTTAPPRREGTMEWSIQEQVRFMAALEGGQVVSPSASRYLLSVMRPIPQHSWGLGRIGAPSFKGGWLRTDTETRQMGIVDGYAVAIITDAVGPALVQTDGDSAHVEQMDRLAGQLKARLAASKPPEKR